MDAAGTRELLDGSSCASDDRLRWATISHFHFDAAGGIAALRAAGVRTVASTETARLLNERGRAMQREHGAAFTGWVVPPPDTTLEPAGGCSARIGGSTTRPR